MLCVAEGHGCSHATILEDADEVVAMLDRCDDRQARAEIIDRLRRDAEAGDSRDSRDHPDVAGAEQLEIVGAADGWPP
jgi:hypothetical protein